jgi:hypothetical protein
LEIDISQPSWIIIFETAISTGLVLRLSTLLILFLVFMLVCIHSGHTAVRVGKSGGLVAVFGGLVERKFLNDLKVLDTGKLLLDYKFIVVLSEMSKETSGECAWIITARLKNDFMARADHQF